MLKFSNVPFLTQPALWDGAFLTRHHLVSEKEKCVVVMGPSKHSRDCAGSQVILHFGG